MIGTIRKHSTWLWVLIIIVVIIAFVFWGAGPPGEDRGRYNFGAIAGEKVSREEMFRTQREIYLRFFFNNGRWPDYRVSDEDIRRETYYRLFLIRKMREMDIHVSPAVAAQTANDILRSVTGQPMSLDAFEKQILNPNASADDFERFIRHELGIQQLISVVAMSGKLVTPEEVRALYVRENQETSAQAAFFSANDYLDKVNVTPEAVGQFFTNQMAAYRLPERVQVSYVKFDPTNYVESAREELAGITNLNARIDELYQQRGANFYGEATSPEEAKEKIREETLNSQALLQARKAATEFASHLFDKEPGRPGDLEGYAKEKGLEVHVTEPFSREEGPREFNLPMDFARAAFELTEEEPFAGPIVGRDGVYVLTMHKRIPSQIPPFDEVREKVTADYQFREASQLARQAGHAFSISLTNALAEGKAFTDAAAAANVTVEKVPPFSLSTRELPEVEKHMSLFQFKQVAYSIKPGNVSQFIPTREGGAVVFVQDKLPVDETRMQAELPAFTDSVRQMRQNEAFNEWFRKEAERALRDTPLGRPQPPVSGGQ
jgi:peptidyl-prolyl cis-trans isomerase D